MRTRGSPDKGASRFCFVAIPAKRARGASCNGPSEPLGLAREKRSAPRTAGATRIESRWRIRWLDPTATDSLPCSLATARRTLAPYVRRVARLRAASPRPVRNAEGGDEEAEAANPEDNPTCEAAELREVGRVAEAHALLIDTLGQDLRVLDAHAGLENIAFDRSPKQSLVHNEIGVRIDELSLAADFDGLLVWGCVHNRGFPGACTAMGFVSGGSETCCRSTRTTTRAFASVGTTSGTVGQGGDAGEGVRSPSTTSPESALRGEMDRAGVRDQHRRGPRVLVCRGDVHGEEQVHPR